MKAMIVATKEVDITHLQITLPINHGNEAIPDDFPLRTKTITNKRDIWKATIEVETGKILEWPQGREEYMYMKVVDGGVYKLIDWHGREVGSLVGDYVPHGLVPGEYGDYVELHINEKGIITNWPEDPNLSDFQEFNKWCS